MTKSRKSTMVSRLLANPNIQISHGTPGGRRERMGAIPLTGRRKTDKHVTNGVGGSKVEGPRTLSREPPSLECSGGRRSRQDHLSGRICFPGLFAGHKDNRRVPKVD